jgi:hypothetical protein
MMSDLTGVGTLAELDSRWCLRYFTCGHTQPFPRTGLENHERAAWFARLYLATCVKCRVHKQQQLPTQ